METSRIQRIVRRLAVTNFFESFGELGPKKSIEIEGKQGTNLAKAAAATGGLQHYIWSTLPDASNISGGKYHIPHFAAKVKVDEFIRSQPDLLAKTTFLWIGFYAQNLYLPMFLPIHVPTAGKYIQVGVTSADTPLDSMGDARVNIGLFAKAAFDQPEKTTGGRAVLAYAEKATIGSTLDAWAIYQDKTAQYVKVNDEAYSALWPGWAEEMIVMMRYYEEYHEKSFGGVSKILTKDELGLTNLVGMEKSFASLRF
jgi:hypothetical protein